MNSNVIVVRKACALAVLGVFTILAIDMGWTESRALYGNIDLTLLMDLAVLLSLLGASIYGLARERVWGRWPGLAVGLLALWKVGSQLLSDLFYGCSPMIIVDWKDVVLAVGGGLLVASLLGATMYGRYDGRVFGELPAGRWDRFRLLVVRWSAVVAITMLPFIVASLVHGAPYCGGLLPGGLYRPVLGALGAGVFVGVVLIARGKTAGVLLIAGAGSLAAWLFGTVFSYGGEVNLFEAACRAGHSLVYLLPALILAAPMLRIIFRRGR